jgi:fumarylacetoacetate (FAA) hydrolase
MFHPNDNPMERGWVGRVDGDRVLHLAAQTLQSFFLGGGGAREHAEYPLAEVRLLAPVLQPPTVRLFDAQEEFAFGNATAVTGPGATLPAGATGLTLVPRVAAVIGADQQIGGYSVLAEWRAPELPAPKDRDFGLVLGPVVVTPDELAPGTIELKARVEAEERLRVLAPPFDWERARAFAAAGTTLRPGDVLAAPAAATLEGVAGSVDVDAAGIGTLRQTIA